MQTLFVRGTFCTLFWRLMIPKVCSGTVSTDSKLTGAEASYWFHVWVLESMKDGRHQVRCNALEFLGNKAI